MPRTYMSHDEFARLWNGAETLDEAADRLGCTKDEAKARAYYHRKCGIALKRMQQPRTSRAALRQADPEFDRLIARLQTKAPLTPDQEARLSEIIRQRAALLRTGALEPFPNPDERSLTHDGVSA